MAFTQAQLEKYADVLVWGLKTARAGEFKPYDTILVNFHHPALPLVEKVYERLVKDKFHVLTYSMHTPAMESSYYAHSDKKLRTDMPDWILKRAKTVNGRLYIGAPQSLTHLKDVEPGHIQDVTLTMKKARDIYRSSEGKGFLGWSLCMYPTPALAEAAGLGLEEYEKQIIKACYLDEDDPVSTWQNILEKSMEIRKWLSSLDIRSFHVESQNCDLHITLGEARRFIGTSGHNLPSFEIFTSPDWRGTNGVYYSNQPSYFRGNLVKDLRLEFSGGEVVSVSAGTGEAFVKKMTEMDKGAKRVGEFSLTDKRFSRIDRFMANTLFDENYGGEYGNCHIAIGMSYSDTFSGAVSKLGKTKKKKLGFNDSALHWDLVNIENKKVTARLKDGGTKTIYEDGEFSY